ncbi:hypothetical protein VN97_g3451 [Penicillium thymicola]|uniref:Uncharacterized protein n=1 Tax=Penicillium thymicola TaxID=293382 RepID=A0AAI9TNM6_PENTH|nr:hypothetical protein VN97_g3451 [Penicillium thymicola]
MRSFKVSNWLSHHLLFDLRQVRNQHPPSLKDYYQGLGFVFGSSLKFRVKSIQPNRFRWECTELPSNLSPLSCQDYVGQIRSCSGRSFRRSVAV